MKDTGKAHFRPDWLLKTSAGLVCGLALAYVFVAFFAWYGPGGIDAQDKVQFNMWIITPIWFAILAGVYMFRSGKQAWVGLGLPTALLYGLFVVMRG